MPPGLCRALPQLVSLLPGLGRGSAGLRQGGLAEAEGVVEGPGHGDLLAIGPPDVVLDAGDHPDPGWLQLALPALDEAALLVPAGNRLHVADPARVLESVGHALLPRPYLDPLAHLDHIRPPEH